MENNSTELLHYLDSIIMRVMDDKKQWENRRRIAQERIEECEAELRTLDILRMEILFKAD